MCHVEHVSGQTIYKTKQHGKWRLVGRTGLTSQFATFNPEISGPFICIEKDG